MENLDSLWQNCFAGTANLARMNAYVPSKISAQFQLNGFLQHSRHRYNASVQYNTLISVKILDGDKVLFKKEMVIEQDRAFFGVKLNSFIGLILILWVLTLVIPPSILFSNSIKSWKLGLSIFLFVSPLIFGLIASVFLINSMVYGESQYHLSQYALILLCFFIVLILSRFLYKLLFQKKILL